VLAAAPDLMRFLRAQMRRRREGLTIPHFRALIFVRHNPSGSLSELAEHIGLSLPAASRLVAVLVRRGLMDRRPQRADRRFVALMLTARGRALVDSAYRGTRRALAAELSVLSPPNLESVTRTMRILQGLFARK
jgi:DNA-binding MarR family transcriptional regulator